MNNSISIEDVKEAVNNAQYTSCYCEENVYKLAQALSSQTTVRVGFISNESRSVLLFEQEASQYDAPHPVLWDYHVILLLSLAGREYVVDLDTRLDKVIEKNAYLEHTFSSKTPPAYRASISVTPAHIFLNTFASDRRHMKSASGVFSSPPPPWSCIKGTDASSPHNLDDWIDGAIDGSEVIQPVYV